MSARTISLTLYGSIVSGLTFSVGESVLFDVLLQDPLTRLPVDVTSATARLSLSVIDIQNNPIAPPISTKTAMVIAPAVNGHVQVSFIQGDTSALLPGGYMIDFWVTDGSGNRQAFMPLSRLVLTGAATTA